MSSFEEKVLAHMGRISARIEEIGAQVTAIRAQQSGIVHRLTRIESDAREALIHAQNAHIAVGDLYSLAVDTDDAERGGLHEQH